MTAELVARFGEVWLGLAKFGEVLKNTRQTLPALTLGRFWLGEEEVRPVCSYIIILQGEVRDATPLQSRSSLHCTGAPPSNGAPSTAFPLPSRLLSTLVVSSAHHPFSS